MSAGARRDTVERLLATMPFNTYYRLRLGTVGDGECALEVPVCDVAAEDTASQP